MQELLITFIFKFQNAPKYIACLDYEKELDFHYKVHTSLDIIEEKLNSSVKTAAEPKELYLGLLYATEEHKMYPLVISSEYLFTL